MKQGTQWLALIWEMKLCYFAEDILMVTIPLKIALRKWSFEKISYVHSLRNEVGP